MAFYADYHCHSRCSPDSSAPMAEMARQAVKLGMTELCLTDHCDFLTLEGNELVTDYDWTAVLSEREQMCSRYGQTMDFPLGLEFGMSFLAPEAAQQVLAQPGLDFVLGAAHNLSPSAGGTDFYFVPYETEADCMRALDDYFDSLLTLAKTPYYDVLAHIFYPLRYMERGGRTISLAPYMDRIREILRCAAERGRGMEINTWKGKTLADWRPILRLFREVHGEIVTVGSDAHAPAPLGLGVQEAYRMMREEGFSYVASYRERKAIFHKL